MHWVPVLAGDDPFEQIQPTELANLLTFDAHIRTYGMDADELEDLILQVRCLYRGGDATEPSTPAGEVMRGLLREARSKKLATA